MVGMVAEALRGKNQIGSDVVVQRGEIMTQRLPDGVLAAHAREQVRRGGVATMGGLTIVPVPGVSEVGKSGVSRVLRPAQRHVIHFRRDAFVGLAAEGKTLRGRHRGGEDRAENHPPAGIIGQAQQRAAAGESHVVEVRREKKRRGHGGRRVQSRCGAAR